MLPSCGQSRSSENASRRRRANCSPLFSKPSKATAREIDSAVKSIIDGAFRRTVNLLRAQREVLERGARLLLEHETLDEADLLALRQPGPVVGAEPAR